MMYRQITYILISTLLFSCGKNINESADNSTDLESVPKKKKQEISSYITDCGIIEENIKVKQISENIRVFTDVGLVYCSPTETSKVIDTLPFNTDVKAIELVVHKNSEWYRISNSNKSSFVKKENLSINSYNHLGYMVGYKVTDKNQIELKSFSGNRGKDVVDNYLIEVYEGNIKIENLPFNGLENTGILIKYETLHNFDPTVYYYEFVAYNADSRTFKKIVSYSSAYTDMCEFEEEIFYFPMKFGNGKILLVEDADYEHIFNYQTAELNVFEYPENINIPIGQLIVKINRKAECVIDDEGSQIIDPKTGNPKMKIVENKPIYYRWDGDKLIAN